MLSCAEWREPCFCVGAFIHRSSKGLSWFVKGEDDVFCAKISLYLFFPEVAPFRVGVSQVKCIEFAWF